MDSARAETPGASSPGTARRARCAAERGGGATTFGRCARVRPLLSNGMTQAATERLPLRRRLEQERGRVWVVGHRGAMGHCPENTPASFERGLELGADWIELDVHLSRDGALVVIHDETVDRTTNGHGAVRDHTLAELEALDAGSWFGADYAGQRIPTLDEVLTWARRRDTIVDIEIKNAPVYYPGIEAAVVEALRRHA